MAISKVILNGVTQMDVTQDTVEANKLLSGETATKNDGTKVTGNISSKSSSDLTVSGATVTAPAGYYPNAASRAVTSGNAGTPTATKGTVSNNSVSVTPSVTNTTGYITGSTKTGTAVTVSASELVSGNLNITENGDNIDVTNYATVSVDVAGEIVEEKQVNFYDYDGTRLYSYTAAEINSMTQGSELPANPSHTGLTAQGWNWNLANIKAQLTNAPGGIVEVGQTYNTTSGATEIDITLNDANYLSPYLMLAPNGTLDVDWGDSTAHSTVTGSSTSTQVYTQHVYSAPGDYTIKITVSSGTFTFRGTGQYDAGVLMVTDQAGLTRRSRTYSEGIKHIRLGTGLTYQIGAYAFSGCPNLETITLPTSTVNNISDYAFFLCSSLKYVVLPKNIESLTSNTFSECHSLKGVSRRGNGSINFGTYIFYKCGALEHITIRTNDTLSNNVFDSCISLKEAIIPDGASGAGQNSLFKLCNNLQSVRMPAGATYIYTNCFQGCYSLGTKFTIPENVAEISSGAFNTCYSIREYHILRTTPPTLAAADAFGWVQYAGYIYVPYSSDHSVLNAYKTATTWVALADYILEEPQS